MNAHTPGPWFASSEQGYGDLNGIQICGRAGYCLAVAIGDVPELPAQDNARLMAAAPDLLEALQYVMSAHGEQLDDAFHQAHKAIARATGNTP